MILRRSFMMACLMGLFVVVGGAFAADKPEDVAQSAAESWLRVVDDGNYSASWEQAARVLKSAVKQADWGRIAGGVRNRLGKLVSRKLKSREYTEKMPSAPDGKYVVIQYDTVFEHEASAVERVVPMVDPDGIWRVAGYSIR